jgi:hypothetical protein
MPSCYLPQDVGAVSLEFFPQQPSITAKNDARFQTWACTMDLHVVLAPLKFGPHRGSRRLDAARNMKHEANVKYLDVLFVMETRTLTLYETCNVRRGYRTGSNFLFHLHWDSVGEVSFVMRVPNIWVISRSGSVAVRSDYSFTTKPCAIQPMVKVR